MNTAATLNDLHNVRARLTAGERLRLLIGERFYDASEITLTADFQAELRARLTTDIDKGIAELTGSIEPDPPPAAPGAAMPVPQAEGAP